MVVSSDCSDKSIDCLHGAATMLQRFMAPSFEEEG